MGTVLLITGAPGCGKTTLLGARLAALPGRPGGFLTERNREDLKGALLGRLLAEIRA